MIKRALLKVLLPLGLICTPLVLADVVKIPVGQQSGVVEIMSKPLLGATQAMVLDQFGEPFKRFDAVGQPPISRWQYPDFTVYFESDVVMHSVLQHQPTGADVTADQE